jgi:hypothetical protein
MATPRMSTVPTAEEIDRFCGHVDDLFCRLAERAALRHYLIGLLLPLERNKTLTELAALVPGTDRQRLHHFLRDAPWDPDVLGAGRVELWRGHPELGPYGNGVLIFDETGDRKRGHGIVLAAQQYIGKLGRSASGVVAVTSHWADGNRHVPLGVGPYRPASRLPGGKADPAFATKPELAWDLIEQARGVGVPFRAVADCVYGENPKLEASVGRQDPLCADPRPRHGTSVRRRSGPSAGVHSRRGRRPPGRCRTGGAWCCSNWVPATAHPGHAPDRRHAPTRPDPPPTRPGSRPPIARWPRRTPPRSTGSTGYGTGSSTLQAGQARAGLGGLPGPFRRGHRAGLTADEAGVHRQPAYRATTPLELAALLNHVSHSHPLATPT